MSERRDPASGPVEPPIETALSQMIAGYRISQAIFVAVKLGIVDGLTEGSRSAEELAASAGLNPPALHRLLVVLANAGVLREVEPTRFALTPTGALLQEGRPLRHSAVLGAELFWRAYGELAYTVQTGQSAFQRAFGMPIYDYLPRNPQADAAYAGAMTAATAAMAAVLTDSYDFSGVSTVVDVGGGRGALLSRILTAHPHLRGILFDRAPTVGGTADALEIDQVASRCQVVSGNFFEELPAGADLYILKWVISEWSDDRAGVILSNCRRAMHPRGRLLIIEPLDLPSNALFNLNMLVTWNGGRVRSSADLAALLRDAGFTTERVIPTPSPLSIVECRAGAVS